MNAEQTYDTAVIGAGVFGAWTAYHLREAGQSVALLDGYGPANSRASSGGESRIIRMGYGADEVYTRWAARSLALWQDLFRQVGRPLFHRTGVLWLAQADDPYTLATLGTFAQVGVKFERLTLAELVRQRLGRFVRKSLSLSKSDTMHEICLRLFLHDYNKSVALSSD